MANATLRDLSADTDIGTTDVMPKQGVSGALKKITGTNIKSSLESGGGIALSLAASQAAAAGGDKRVSYNNSTARGGDANLVDATSVVILPRSSSTLTPTLSFGDGDTGILERDDGVLGVSCGGTLALTVGASRMYAFGRGSFSGGIVNEATSGNNPTLCPVADDLDTGIGSSAADRLTVTCGASEVLRCVEGAEDFCCITSDPLPPRMSQDVLRDVPAGFVTMVIDETNDQLEFWFRHSGGATIQVGVIALS